MLTLALPAASQSPDAAASFPDVPAADAAAPADSPDGGEVLPPQPARPETASPSAAPSPVWPSPAPAARAPPPAPLVDSGLPPPPPERVWYGWQTLPVDGLSLGCVVFGASGKPQGLAAVGGLGYLLGAPIVHAAHGHAGKTFGSLGLRVGLPLGGVMLGCAAQGDDGGDYGCAGGAAIGFLLGGIAAITLDATVIAYEDAPEHRARIGVVPSLVVTKERSALGLSGWF